MGISRSRKQCKEKPKMPLPLAVFKESKVGHTPDRDSLGQEVGDPVLRQGLTKVNK